MGETDGCAPWLMGETDSSAHLDRNNISGYDGPMKTTVHIHDELLSRAKRYAREKGMPLRAVVEEGLRTLLSADAAPEPYRMPDLSVGDPNGDDPLEAYSWQDLSEIIYEHPPER